MSVFYCTNLVPFQFLCAPTHIKKRGSVGRSVGRYLDGPRDAQKVFGLLTDKEMTGVFTLNPKFLDAFILNKDH